MSTIDTPFAPSEIIIRSENDAWEWLATAVRDGADFSEVRALKFDGWPDHEIALNLGDASIWPSMMTAFLELQDSIYRTYALVKYDTSKLVNLTHDEKRGLEIEVMVREGSSDYKIKPEDILNKIIEVAGEKMEAKHWVILGLATGIMFFGDNAWDSYLQNRLEMRRAEITSKEKQETLKTLRFSSEQETTRMKIMERALGRVRELPDIDDHADSAKRSLLKGVPEEATVDINGKSVDGYVANELAKNPRNESRLVTFEGEFQILRVDTTSPIGFRVRLRNRETGEEFTAHLRDALVSEDERAAIQRAEWRKVPIKCQIEATRRGGAMVDAVIRSAEPIESSDASN